MIRRPPRSTLSSSSAASDVYKRQVSTQSTGVFALPGWKTSQHRMGLLDKIKSNLKERTDNLRERIHTTRRKFSSNKNQESADECPSDETGLTAADSDSDSDDLSDVSPSTRASQYDADAVAGQRSSRGLLRREIGEVAGDDDGIVTTRYAPKRTTAPTDRRRRDSEDTAGEDPLTPPLRSRALSFGDNAEEMDMELARAAEMIRAIDLKRGKPVPVAELDLGSWDGPAVEMSRPQPCVGFDLSEDEMASLDAVTQPSRVEMVVMEGMPPLPDVHGRDRRISTHEFFYSLDDVPEPGVLSRLCSALNCFRPTGFQPVQHE
eukprot:TRINITY_DN9333_c0_g1_i1.p1 TRINITY_DN9333_c0_g1~~TRINITY_DN9333_c0_g1_i1.p1  ORF type:complete len:320 (-),score=68.02 TRINITY_DN9333_c0_g1_i1:195-1154(-)